MLNMPTIEPEARLFYAKMVHDRIQSLVLEETRKLTGEQSILVEVPISNGKMITAHSFGYQNPNFVLVQGIDENGNNTTALLSHTCIQVIITTLNKTSERPKIGFQS